MIIINIILGHFYTNVSSDEQEKRSITNKGHQHTSKLNHYIYSTSLSSGQKRDQKYIHTFPVSIIKRIYKSARF